ncbi:MAG: protein translocase subunit SecF [Terricaulis sp.]
MAWPLIKLLPKKTNLKFVRFAFLAGFVSLGLVIASFASMFTAGFRENPVEIWQSAAGGPMDRVGAILMRGFNLGIDFRGGAVLELTAEQPIDLETVRSGLGALDLGDVQVQSFNDPTHAMVRYQIAGGEPSAITQRVQAQLQSLVPGVTFSRVEVVGPKVSRELFEGGLQALGYAIVLMLIYIWFRFELQFGFGAVLALFHDTILTLGLFSVFRIEFTLTIIAALLTIIGYSMNDTVVVFDRLRENYRKYKRMPRPEVIDLSTNETLSRTMMTSVTALLAALALWVYGGDTLRGFAIAMTFGIFIGTYSSIYVAAPATLLWAKDRGARSAAAPAPQDAQ